MSRSPVDVSANTNPDWKAETRLQTLIPEQERAILVGLALGARERPLVEESLQELRELVESAGAEAVQILCQERPEPDPAFLIGQGKVELLKEAVFGEEADLVVFDDELSPAQQRNLERELEVKVIDRSALILDIFAQRARSREGKLQVELALLEYMLPRLTGKGTALSRLGGGIGTRGPGETKLESDRRVIRRRIARIKGDLGHLVERRNLHRAKRKGVPIPTVSLVGYTNAGKSTLFNRLTRENTFVSPRMFATLDPLVRRLALPSGQEILLSDTVGFIRKLPHQLVAAFRATLEETSEADLLMHVIDLSDPNSTRFRSAVYGVLEEIGADTLPIIEVYNKIDRLPEALPVSSQRESVCVSARTGEGIDELLQVIERTIGAEFEQASLRIPFSHGRLVAVLRERGRIEKLEYREDGIHVRVRLRDSDLAQFIQWRVPADPTLDLEPARRSGR